MFMHNIMRGFMFLSVALLVWFVFSGIMSRSVISQAAFLLC